MTPLLTPFDDENEEPTPVESRVTVKIEDDSTVGQPQLVLSLAEAKAMFRMPGGICLTNWMRLRGLLDEEFRES